MVSQGNQGEVQVFPEGWVFLFCGHLLADALKQPGVNRPPDNNRVRHVTTNATKKLTPLVRSAPFPAMTWGKKGGHGKEEDGNLVAMQFSARRADHYNTYADYEKRHSHVAL